MLDKSYYQKTDEIISHYGRKPSALIPIMQDIQAEYRYLPGELLTYVAKEIGAVSYTHLDVYKRQTDACTELLFLVKADFRCKSIGIIKLFFVSFPLLDFHFIFRYFISRTQHLSLIHI